MNANERDEAMQSIVRDYWSVWKQFVLHGVTQEEILPPALMLSWRRCAALGIDPYGEIGPENNAHYISPQASLNMLSLVRPTTAPTSLSSVHTTSVMLSPYTH